MRHGTTMSNGMTATRIVSQRETAAQGNSPESTRPPRRFFRQRLKEPLKEPFVRAMRDENPFFFLLAARWLMLLPPGLALLLRPAPNTVPLAVFGAAMSGNLLLSVWHPRLNRWLVRQPLLLGVDMALSAAFLGLTGGTASPYFFYALTPLLAAAFFFQIRGGLMAAAAFTLFYLLATLTSSRLTGSAFDVITASGAILSFHGIALVFGYPSILLLRLREASAQLHSAQEELAGASTLAALGKMVAHIGHEIRNPLSTLGGYAARIARKTQDETTRHDAQIIAGEIKRLEELLNDLLAVSRPRQPVMYQDDLHDVLDRACLLTGSELGESPVQIRKEYDAALPEIKMNAPSLLRAFLNVIRNAIQAMPEGGTLTISTLHAGHDGEVQVTITDTGAGIAAEELPHIFEPFVTHRKGEQGTGLGLAVTQQIMHDHGGRIEAQSEAGRGTRFTFHLPVNGAAG